MFLAFHNAKDLRNRKKQSDEFVFLVFLIIFAITKPNRKRIMLTLQNNTA